MSASPRGRVLLHSALIAITLGSTAGCGGGDTPVAPPTTPAPTPTIAVAATPSSFSAVAGSSASAGLTVTRGVGFAGEVTLSTSGAPEGMTVAVLPASLGPLITSGTVLANVAATVAARAYSVSVVARSAANGQITGSTTLTITVIVAQ